MINNLVLKNFFTLNKIIILKVENIDSWFSIVKNLLKDSYNGSKTLEYKEKYEYKETYYCDEFYNFVYNVWLQRTYIEYDYNTHMINFKEVDLDSNKTVTLHTISLNELYKLIEEKFVKQFLDIKGYI